ncbi:MAG TPA: PrsW family glutamic-type intramembrane protease [Bacteroidales bacterium]|nr:PrsW family glutamic-type intramembrane protease [Bacteroidales bacterium]
MNFLEIVSIAVPLVIAAALIGIIKYKFPKGNISSLVYAFIWGIFAGLASLFIQYLAHQINLDLLRSLKRMTFYAFIVIGGAQEFFKFLVLRFYALPLKAFKGPSDGIIYSIIISMACCFVILISYTLNPAMEDLNYYYPMITTIGLAGVIFAIFMGYFIGLGKARKNRFVDSMTGLVAAAFIHGLYKFCFYTEEYALGAIAAIVELIIAIIFIGMAVRTQEAL